jgi:hypothetical protein
LIVHAAKTGRFWPWGFIILFIPGFGALAYVLIEHVPMARSPSHAPNVFNVLMRRAAGVGSERLTKG